MGGLISELRTRGPEPTYLAGLLLRDPMQVVNTDWRSGRVVESNDTSLEAWRDGADESLDL